MPKVVKKVVKKTFEDELLKKIKALQPEKNNKFRISRLGIKMPSSKECWKALKNLEKKKILYHIGGDSWTRFK